VWKKLATSGAGKKTSTQDPSKQPRGGSCRPRIRWKWGDACVCAPLYSACPIIRGAHASGGRERIPDGTHHHGGCAPPTGTNGRERNPCAPPRARSGPVRAPARVNGSHARPRARERVPCAPPRARTGSVCASMGAIGSRARPHGRERVPCAPP
jgi:hypothetical protein